MCQGLIKIEYYGLLYAWLGVRQLNHPRIHFLKVNIFKLLQEMNGLENVNREFPKDWPLQLKMLQSRFLLISLSFALLLIFSVIVSKNMARYRGSERGD